MNKRNVAIIAHVDHGKTSIVNAIIKESIKEEHIDLDSVNVDSDSIEQERGITIISKVTGINYKGYDIKIMDTPGHADFGGEVERILGMVDGVLLVVDSYEGVMPQTRFVLKKALKHNLIPILIINKVDKEEARLSEVLDEVYELFIELDASEEQLEFPVIYASAINETSSYSSDLSTQEKGFEKVLDKIIEVIPEPKKEESGNFQMQVVMLGYDDYVGRIAVGTITKGSIKVGETVECLKRDGSKKTFRIQKLYGYKGIKTVEIKEATTGDICGIAGYPEIEVGETLGKPGLVEALPFLKIDEPTLKMTFSANSSPFAGLDGDFVTAREIKNRLYKEVQKDVSLKVDFSQSEKFVVAGRGELHLSILLENMRREGFEVEVSKPEVIIKEINGIKNEPFENLEVEVLSENVGGVIEALNSRGGVLDDMVSKNNTVHLKYTIPSRTLMGFDSEFMTLSKGLGVMSHNFKEYFPLNESNFTKRSNGVLISNGKGKTTAYSLGSVEKRGVMFVGPGVDVYEGMIVGENSHSEDLVVNVIKGKQLTNMRAAGSDATVVLKRPRPINLEYALNYIEDDELVEITPKNIRLRKKNLNVKR